MTSAPLGSTGRSLRGHPHTSNTDMKLLPMPVESLMVKHLRGVRPPKCNTKPRTFASLPPAKNSCKQMWFVAPRSSIHALRHQNYPHPPKLNSNLVWKIILSKLYNFFSVNHALKIKIASVKDIYNIYAISANSYVQGYQILFCLLYTIASCISVLQLQVLQTADAPHGGGNYVQISDAWSRQAPSQPHPPLRPVDIEATRAEVDKA